MNEEQLYAKWTKGTVYEGIPVKKITIKKTQKRFVNDKLQPTEILNGKAIIELKGKLILIEIEEGYKKNIFILEEKNEENKTGLTEINATTIEKLKNGIA